MPLFRESNFLVVHPGSKHTVFSFGLQDSLSPPQYKIPSVVYLDADTNEYKAKKDEGEDLAEVYPIEQGNIVDIDGFNNLIRIILQSVIHENPIITINQIPLLLISPSITWSRAHIEYVTKYVMETLEFSAFNLVDLSVASNFGVGSTSSSCVVNVGFETTQIMPVIGYRPIKFAGRAVPGIGGNTINQELAKLLPNLSPSQIEALKTSDIYEIVNDHSGSFYTLTDINTIGDGDGSADDFDVAKLVTEENGDLAKDGEQEPAEEEKPNKELEKNTFVDPETEAMISVGKERFQGSSTLISVIAENIYESLLTIPDLEKRQECYDNLIFVGSTFKIRGLKEAILIKLSTDYLVTAPSESSGPNESAVNSAILAYQRADDADDSNGESNFILSQVPSAIKSAKHPDYFPEWKKPKEKGGSWEDIYFLGAEIYAKQIFGGNSNQGGELFVDSDVYEEKGPQGIWDVVI